MLRQCIKVLSIIALTIASQTSQANFWEIHSLGNLGSNAIVVTDINNAGQVVGYGRTEPRLIDPTAPAEPLSRGFISGPNGGPLIELNPLPGGNWSEATAINNLGQVVGRSTTVGGAYEFVFVTGPNGVGMQATRPDSLPHDINDLGQILYQDFINGPGPGYLGNADGSYKQITLSNNELATPVAVNNAGHVAAYDNQTGNSYIWTANEGARLLENVPDGRLTDMNEAGQIIGTLAHEGAYQAFITDPNGGAVRFIGPTVDYYHPQHNTPLHVNNLGQVIGIGTFPEGTDLNYLTSPSDYNHFIYLDMLEEIVSAGWSQLVPSALNDRGQIAGTGSLHGITQAFLLSPTTVPEPTTLLLILVGMGMMAFTTRRPHRPATTIYYKPFKGPIFIVE